VDVPNEAFRAVIDEVGKGVRVRVMPDMEFAIHRVHSNGDKLKLVAKPYPYPAGHLDRAMVHRARQLVSPLKPASKPDLTVVLGIVKTCTAGEFFMAVTEDA
jgi:hypothetical protein